VTRLLLALLLACSGCGHVHPAVEARDAYAAAVAACEVYRLTSERDPRVDAACAELVDVCTEKR
jgi:hypothetical protein